jgi:hypothetical protein
MTMTRPCRRITLQCSQIGLTLGLTFMLFLFAVFVLAADAASRYFPAGAAQR